MVSIKVEGLEEAKVFLKQKNKRAIALMRQGVANGTIFLQGEVKQSIAGERAEHRSVDTGRFLNSVDVTIKPDMGVVKSDLEYAEFLEFGSSKFRGRRHFTNSANRNKAKVKQLIEDQIKKI